MHAVFLIDNLLFGGAQKFLGQLAAGLHARGWTQTVVCLNRADEEHLRHSRSRGIRVLRLSPPQVASGIGFFRVFRLLRREKADVVMSVLTFSDLVGRGAGRLAGVPARVSAIRGHKAPWELALGRLNARHVGAFTANAASLVAHTAKGEGVSETKIHLIPNAIDCARFDGFDAAAERRRLGIPDGHRLLLCLGRLSPEKGQRVLLRAMPEVFVHHPAVTVLCVGNGPDLAACEALAKGDGRLRFLPAAADVRPLLAAADALVIPSLHEAFPNVLLEAMAARLPVVASRYGAIPDVLAEGETGFLAAPGDASDLAARLNGLLGDPARMALGPTASALQVEALRREMGLDRPLPVQYVRYLAGLVRLDLGDSLLTRREVRRGGGPVFATLLCLLILGWS
jgi:glycosyltransferase involved in cell wall biosynthesis